MARDATPVQIELVNDNFSNENHRDIAAILEEEWDAQTTFTDLGDRYDHDRATFQKVYKRYFGVPEDIFNDGIHDDRTIEELREEFGSYKEYRERRKKGLIDMEPGKDVTEKEMELIQEGYRKGYSDGFKDGMEQSDN